MALWMKRDKAKIDELSTPRRAHHSGLVVHSTDLAECPDEVQKLFTNLADLDAEPVHRTGPLKNVK